MPHAQSRRVSKCAQYYADNYAEASERMLDNMIPLPCGCGEVSVRELVSAYTCATCDKVFWYSFCLEQVVEEDMTWHCEICGSCY